MAVPAVLNKVKLQDLNTLVPSLTTLPHVSNLQPH